ncbi:MAG TPA: hypothetical protein VGJ97_08005 [Anaerolineaceae bacterium]|jgi:hypothetical protein
MIKQLIRTCVVLLAAGIISGGMVLLVQNGILTNQSVAALASRDGGAGRQFDRTQLNPPIGFSAPVIGGAFRSRGGFNLDAGLSGIVHNLLMIAGITVGVLVARKLLGAGIQMVRRGR